MTLIQEGVKKMYKHIANEVILPSTFQQVEYISCDSAGPYIDTGVVPTSATKSQIHFINKAITGNTIYGFTLTDSNDYRLFNYSGNIYFDMSSSRINGNSLVANTEYNLEIGNYYVKNVGASSNLINGNAVTGWTGNYSIHLNGSSSPSMNTWYSVKIWENDVQIRNMVPCYRKSDSVIGMYDTINDVFYINQGSGTFTMGPEMPASNEKEVKKVFKGTQLIRPVQGTLPDEVYNFPAADLVSNCYPGWTLRSGGFAQGSLGADWAAPYSSNVTCVMYRAAPQGNFKIQHREAFYADTWGGTSQCGVCTQQNWNNQARPREVNTQFCYWSTWAGGYNSGSSIIINNTTQLNVGNLVSGYVYIDEIIYEDGVFTVSLYEDNNGEPGTQLYTASASGEAPDILFLRHEVGTGTASQTNRIKVWHL